MFRRLQLRVDKGHVRCRRNASKSLRTRGVARSMGITEAYGARDRCGTEWLLSHLEPPGWALG